MLGEILLSLLPYTLVTAFTPGPNNILALNTISNYGWKKGRPLIAGIASGFLCVMVVCALGCFELAKYLPQITGVLKYVGAAYILWLAVHVARSKPGGESQTKGGSFWTGFVLQFLNIKIILCGITAYTGYVLPVSQSIAHLLAAGAVIALIGTSGTLTWASMGGLLQTYINRYYRPFNIAMALVLVWSAVKLFV